MICRWSECISCLISDDDLAGKPWLGIDADQKKMSEKGTAHVQSGALLLAGQHSRAAHCPRPNEAHAFIKVSLLHPWACHALMNT